MSTEKEKEKTALPDKLLDNISEEISIVKDEYGGVYAQIYMHDKASIVTERLNEYIHTASHEGEHKIQRLASKRKELERQKANIIEAVTKTGFQDVFTSQLESIEQELSEISAKLESINTSIPKNDITEDMVRSYISQFKQFVQTRDVPQIKNFIDSYVQHVDVYKEYVKVTFKVALSFCLDEQSENIYHFSEEISRRGLLLFKSA